ncbi:Programmed cell death protein 2-like [Geodia barretti]|uniref:Programmed cell death protein 2-like n=1 Tax=Geodia barretti TaxID=519541 RepID=A0AA35WQK1_GEOBA|nr:Programmed cell death protein 2-like [Geodia barretti]
MYMYVVEQPTEWKPSDLKQVEELLQKYKTENEDGFDVPSSLEGGSGCEAYEKTVARHGDRAFHKLKKRLSLCPNQVLRYCWKGEPLLIGDSNRPPDPSQITCKTCGSKSVFEFQLMPPLVYLLRPTEKGKREKESVGGTAVLVVAWSLEQWPCTVVLRAVGVVKMMVGSGRSRFGLWLIQSRNLSVN